MHKSGVEPLVLNWNKLAMENLREEKYSESFRLLQKAEELLKYPDGTDPSKLLGITYNNLGCFYKKTEKYSLALRYLFKALDIEISSIFDKTNLAGTHLNISAVHSVMNQHEKALSHGIIATKLLKEANEVDKSITTMTSLIISLSNTGLEYEFLKDFENSKATYKCGLELAVKQLGTTHPITVALRKSYENIKEKRGKKRYSKKKTILLNKRDSGGLPTIKMPGRNKSVGSNSKLSVQIVMKGIRANSNKAFEERKSMREQLPVLGKTRTVSKRSKKVIKDQKIHGLEDKITELQNQISLCQQKYKKLEEIASRGRMDKLNAVVVIQRAWRKYSKQKAADIKNTLKDLEYLKRQMFKENLQNAKIKTINTKETQIIQPGKIRPFLNRFHIRTPLDTIPESKIETKAMKAILIQSCIRQYLARKKFRKIRAAVIKIQKNFKQYQCRHLFAYIRSSIILIQRSWRFYYYNRKVL